MLRIRLRRVGAKKFPSYRIVVADSKSPRDGRFNEIIGTYDPMKDPAEVHLDQVKAAYWIKLGAQPSEPVARFLKKLNGTETPYETATVASEGTA